MEHCPLCDSYDWEVQELDFDALELDGNDNLSVRGKCQCYSCNNIFEVTLKYRIYGTSNPHIICKMEA